MQPEKIDLTAASISDDKLDQLRQLLPEVFHEGKINFDDLRNALGDYVEEDPANERFGLRWPGKSRLQQVINTPSVGTLVPQPEESVDWDTTGNVIIEGDNLEVLKLLQKSYAGKVKMIYIDPPYNTGNDFVYPDKYASGIDTYLELTGQTDENGSNLSTNSDTSGRYHANWLNMIYPRLYLARNLLRQDGVIFVSIDDHESANLVAAMDQVFGAENFIAKAVWQKKQSPQRDATLLSYTHDYIVIYGRRVDSHGVSGHNVLNRLALSEARLSSYSNPDNDPRGVWASTDLTVNKTASERPNLFYSIVNPISGASVTPSGSRTWSFDRESMDKLLSEGRVWWGSKDGSFPRLKVFASENQNGLVPASLWLRELVGDNQESTRELGRLFPDVIRAFDSPKPTRLLAHMLKLGTTSEEGAVILDFFAGSGTAGHAVMQQNAEDGGNRKFILVQLPEPMEKKVLDDGTELTTIADVCRERVRRAGKKISEEHPDKAIDTGFRAYKLTPSNFSPWDGTNDGAAETKPLLTSARQASFMPQTEQLTLEERILHAADHLSPDASDIAVLTELLLKLGEELTVPVEQLTLAGKTVYNVDANLRLICLERNLTLDVIRAMAEREPGEIICLDAGFPDDQTKVNAGQIIATQARQTESAIAFKVV